MKKFTSFLMLALVSVFGATTANAQDLIPWDENGQFRLYPEDLICEGGVEWDDNEYAFHFTGTEPGRIYLRAVGEGAKTIDFSEVASIETFGPAGKEDPWGTADPCATLYVHDAVNGRINEWFGSRYNLSYKDYAKNSAKIDSIYFTSRAITDESGAVTGYVEGYVSIDEIVLTKSEEVDPMAILPQFWHEWDGFGADAQP
ncbi:MAG: hypothetical protein HUK08_04470, partial [Bacteroidaceae bacterium]|nr:hypothetical protein [Bacteroidaceae bacterium]